MDIPILAVCLLGIGASLKYTYRVVFHGMYKNIGSMVAIIYLTIVYISLLFPQATFHGGPFVRVGVTLLFIDKVLVFLYELHMARKAVKKMVTIGGGGE